MGEPLTLKNNKLVGVISDSKYPIINGIPSIINYDVIPFKSKIYKLTYDLASGFYDKLLEIGEKSSISSDNKARKAYLSKFQFPSTGKIFESAIGTGLNMNFYPPHLEIFGSDISLWMLQKIQRKYQGKDTNIHLIHAEGSFLPLRDELFNMVIQFGALQFHHDPFKTITEMCRIAKPGSSIHIVEEVRGISKILKKMPAHQKYSSPPKLAVKSLSRLVPHNMKNIKSGMIDETDFCFLTFEKEVK